MSKFILPDDITANRHRGSETSVASNSRIRSQKALVRSQIVQYGLRNRDFMAKDIARHLNKPLHSVSGRVAELKALKMIEETDERRENCKVLKLAKFA